MSIVQATEYFKIEKNNTVYAVQPNCCYECVRFEGAIGISSKNDEQEDYINSYDFLCQCHPDEIIIPIFKKEYEEKKNAVLKTLAKKKEKKI